MDKDDRQNAVPAHTGGDHAPRRAQRPAPGKVTRTSKLSTGRGAAVQRKAAAIAGAAAPQARSLWDRRGVLRRLASLSKEEQQERIGRWSSSYADELLGAIGEQDAQAYREVVNRISEVRATSPNVWGLFAERFENHFPSDVLAAFGGP